VCLVGEYNMFSLFSHLSHCLLSFFHYVSCKFLPSSAAHIISGFLLPFPYIFPSLNLLTCLCLHLAGAVSLSPAKIENWWENCRSKGPRIPYSWTFWLILSVGIGQL
jgi:hypothetical protein